MYCISDCIFYFESGLFYCTQHNYIAWLAKKVSVYKYIHVSILYFNNERSKCKYILAMKTLNGHRNANIPNFSDER